MAPSSRRVGTVLGGALVVLLIGLVLVFVGVLSIPVPPPAESSYERTTVAVYDENGTRLGSVEARVADTWRARYTGLSTTTRLPSDEGMLFVFDEQRERTFVMREMDFGIDIVYVAANGTITAIHHAPEPSEGAGGDARYAGEGQYVLEVNRGWTTDHGVEVGDRIVIGGTNGSAAAEPTPTQTQTQTPASSTRTAGS